MNKSFVLLLVLILSFSLSFGDPETELTGSKRDRLNDPEYFVRKDLMKIIHGEGCVWGFHGIIHNSDARERIEIVEIPAGRLVGRDPEFIKEYTRLYKERLISVRKINYNSGAVASGVYFIAVTGMIIAYIMEVI